MFSCTAVAFEQVLTGLNYEALVWRSNTFVRRAHYLLSFNDFRSTDEIVKRGHYSEE